MAHRLGDHSIPPTCTQGRPPARQQQRVADDPQRLEGTSVHSAPATVCGRERYNEGVARRSSNVPVFRDEEMFDSVGENDMDEVFHDSYEYFVGEVPDVNQSRHDEGNYPTHAEYFCASGDHHAPRFESNSPSQEYIILDEYNAEDEIEKR